MTFFKRYRNNINFILALSFTLLSSTSNAQISIAPTSISPLPTNFTHFLQNIRDKEPNSDSAKSIAAYQSNSALTTPQQHQIYHLLGQYTQQKYGQEAISTLQQLVQIPTFRVPSIPSHKNQHFIAIGKAIERIATDFTLDFNNVDNRVFVISLKGSSGKNIALHAHADVVPANKNAWILSDGTKLNPFDLTLIGNRMYGRGTQDDKNAIVTTLYAMKVIKEEGIQLYNTFTLLIDTTEESGADAIHHYLKHNEMPSYHLALDGRYPVVIAEKGYGTLMTTFPVRKDNLIDNNAIFQTLTGGLATNQIPAYATTLIRSNVPDELKNNIDELAQSFISANNNNFTIETVLTEKGLSLRVNGVSAHSSAPASGVNPVSRLLSFIHIINKTLSIQPNHITDAAQYASENWGLDYHGKEMGIDVSDEFMGPLTAALTFIHLDESRLQLAVNLRLPKGKSATQLKKEVKQALDTWVNDSTIPMSYEHTQSTPMFRNPKGKWVSTLLDVASTNLGIEPKFGSSNGTTSIHSLPNGVQFGLALPTEKYTGHNANEFKTVDQFFMDIQIITEMMLRLGNLKNLE